MKEGRSIQALAVELKRREDQKRDFLVPADKHQVVVGLEEVSGRKLRIPRWEIQGVEDRFTMSEHFERQLASRLDIPQTFYQRLRKGFPDLYKSTVNTLLHSQDERRLVRTLDGRARAFLSDRYRRIDNWMVANPVLETLSELETKHGLRIASADVTEKRLYIKAVFPKLEAEVAKVGDVVQAGIEIQNSEVGLGQMEVANMIYTLRCTNGMIGSSALKRRHAGRRIDDSGDDEAIQIFSDETMKADDDVLVMKVRDMVRASVNEATFQLLVKRLGESVDQPIEVPPQKVVELLHESFELSEAEGGAILLHLCAGGQMNQYGLLSAVTRTAQDVESYDRATELEKMGGEILELSKGAWAAMAQNN